MLPLSSAAAEMINLRQTTAQRQAWRKHAGANIAVCAGPVRWCFRIDEGGEFRGASNLVEADAEVTWREGKMHIQGDGDLLKDLEELWQNHSPRQVLGEYIGEDAVADACGVFKQTAEYFDVRDFPDALQFAPPPEAVSQFCQQCAAFSKQVNALAARVSALKTR